MNFSFERAYPMRHPIPPRSARALVPAGVLVVLSLMLAPSVYAAVIVANDGVDGPTCGTKKAPCRSIGRAIANAGVGDKIIVGPGHYGDLDGDGTLGEPGEEKANGSCAAAPVVNVVCVDKPLTIVSRDGAASTVIEARLAPQDSAVVLNAPGAVLGAPKKGFTIIGGEALGVRSPLLVLASSATTVGNRLTGRFGGVSVSGSGHVFRANQMRGILLSVSGSGHQIVGNEIADSSGSGISLFRCRGCRVASNFITGAASDGIQIADDDPSAPGPGNVVEGNVASAGLEDGFGSFRLSAAAAPTNFLFRGNVASRNAGAGFQIDGTAITLTGNAALGNGVAGIQIDPMSASPVLAGNDVIGNGGSNGTLCGVSNLSPLQVAATQSYWGAATGPGPRPADDACSGLGAGVIVTEPFATKPRKVKTKLPRIE